MNNWTLAAGVVVIVLLFYDAYVTTVSTSSAWGPMSHYLGVGIWKALRTVARTPNSPALSVAGPLILFAMLLAWLLGLWAGWFLVFSADPTAVVHEGSQAASDTPSRIYFAGFAVYTLGVGDYVPNGGLWQVLTAVATLNGFVLLSMTVSYLIPVLMAVTERRESGMLLYGLGPTAQDMVRNTWNGEAFEEHHLAASDLASRVVRMAQQYLTYPVLHFFHTPKRASGLEPGLGALNEALLLLEHGVAPSVRPSVIATRPVRAAVERFAEVVDAEFLQPAPAPPPAPDLRPLREAGIPTVSDEEFRAAIDVAQARRRTLVALAADALWPWDSSVETADAGARRPEDG